MRSLRRWNFLLCAGLLGLVSGTVVPMPPGITPAPQHVDAQSLQARQDPDAIEFVNVLITALPQSLRQIAATNVPAVSSILWQEFLDDNRPEWFRKLPIEIQSYLIDAFGPATAAPPESYATPTDIPASVTSQPTETSPWEISRTATSTLRSQVTSATAGSSTSRRATPTSIRASSTASPSQTRSGASSTQSFSSSASHTPESSSTPSASTSAASSAPPSSTPSSTPTDPVAPASSQSGLTRAQKIGIGVGVPLGLFAIAAVLFTCCILVRRHRKRLIEGSLPPSSPGFIPRFSFQIPSTDDYTERLNPYPLHYESTMGERNWDNDDGFDADTAYHRIPPAAPTATTPANMQENHTPMVAPGLYHSHSSNRARGRQISASSLQSVAEMREPDDEGISAVSESPVLGRYYSSHNKRGFAAAAAAANGKREGLETGRIPSLKRRPVPGPAGFGRYSGVGESSSSRRTAAWTGEREGTMSTPARPALALFHVAAQYSGTGSSSSAFAGSSFSSLSSRAYVEDYGPEYYYSGGAYDGGYEEAHIGRGF